MSTWRDQYRDASFRGVPFHVMSSDTTVGRRVVKHEFPGRDQPYMQDLGRSARGFSVEAIVLGDGYMAARDALIAAIETVGPGTLIHPYYGELQVSVASDAKIRESSAEGGSARITFAVVEAGDNIFPTQVTSIDDAVDAAVDDAQSAAQGNFGAGFVATSVPPFVALSAQGLVSDVLGAIAAASATVVGIADQVTALTRSVEDASAGVVDLVADAAGVAASIVSNLQGLTRSVAADARAALGLARQFYAYGADLVAIPTTTISRVQQAQNQALVISLVRTAAAGEAVKAIRGIEFDSFQEAQAILEETSDVIQTLMYSADDETYDRLRALNAVLVQDVTSRGADLSRLVAITTVVSEPALTLAYRLFGDTQAAGDAADDILARNGIVHPLFVPAGAALEVRSNG